VHQDFEELTAFSHQFSVVTVVDRADAAEIGRTKLKADS
jgi:hypothetical protein